MNIYKRTRHAKITGDFGETLVLYWLSKYGFECAPVDHTGIGIIARNPHTQEVMGISVKTRSRNTGTEEEHVSIPNDNFEKADTACKAFGCVPCFAVVVDAGDTIRGFILPMDRLLRLFPKGKTAVGWKMSARYLKQYESDPDIISFEFKTKTRQWWTTPSVPTDSADQPLLIRVEDPTTVATLFRDEPSHWGLRGDPYLWAEMAGRFEDVACPDTPNGLTALIEEAFAALTGFPISHPDNVCVARYSHGGMSSGQVCPEFWRTTVLPLLQGRHPIAQIDPPRSERGE